MVDSEVAVASGSGDLTVILPDSIDHASEIARLKEQLALQDIVRCSHPLVVHQLTFPYLSRAFKDTKSILLNINKLSLVRYVSILCINLSRSLPAVTSLVTTA